MAYLAMPAAIGLALTADRVVHIALGHQWEGVILPLRILSLYYAVYAAQVLVAHVLLWTGHFRANMWFTLLAFVGLMAGFATTVSSGIVAIAWSWVVVYPLVSLPPLLLAARILTMKIGDFFAALAPALLACALMAIAVIAVRVRLDGNFSDIPKLIIEAGTGAATYALVLAVGYRRRILAILRTVFSRDG